MKLQHVEIHNEVVLVSTCVSALDLTQLGLFSWSVCVNLYVQLHLILMYAQSMLLLRYA